MKDDLKHLESKRDKLKTKADERHTMKSYYGKKDNESDGPTMFNKERLAQLAKPHKKEKYKMIHDLHEQAMARDGKKDDRDKQKMIAQKLQKTNKIEFEDYIDRDIPPIRGDTGEFSTSIKTSKGLKNFDTRSDNKKGLFEGLLNDRPDGNTYTEQ